jgi:hypothetical protein
MNSPGPSFFTPRQFESAVAVIDVMIPRENRLLAALQIALRADAFLDAIQPPSGDALRQGLDVLEIALPVLIGHPPPFTKLSYELQRTLLDRIVADTGKLRDLARALKLIATFSYYTDENVRLGTGYIEFEERTQFPTLDTTPHVHHPPK